MQWNKLKWLQLIFYLCLSMTETSGTKLTKCSRHHWGRDDKGIITSYNFPFDYTHNLTCHHKIYLDHLDTSKETEVCLTFYRFSLQDCSVVYNNLRDYIQLKDFVPPGIHYVYQYCGFGDVYDSKSVPIDLLNVWERPFCWQATGQKEFSINFTTNNDLHVFPGFYIEYEILQFSNHISTLKSPNKYGVPCNQPMEWTCFNRECIPQKYVCNAKKDCSDGSDETFEHARCEPILAARNIFACNFEDNMCQLKNSGQGFFSRIRGIEADSYNRGAKYDHSLGYSTGSYYKGFYAVSRFDNVDSRFALKTGTVIHLTDVTTPLTPNKTQCLSFWYHMWGPDPGRLCVHVNQNMARYAWSRVGNFGDEWFQGELQVPDTVEGSKIVYFSAERGGDKHTRIGLDDISVQDGNCSGADISCNFELDMCGWYSTKFHEPSNHFKWKRTSGSGGYYGPSTDASPDQDGYYMAYYAEYLHEEDILITRPVTIASCHLEHDTKACLTFLYYASGMDEYVTLYISQERNNGQTSTVSVKLEASHPDPYNEWTRYSLDIHVTEVIRLRFTPAFVSVPFILAMDEVALHSVQCSDINFGMCNPGEYRCNDGTCILQGYACDGREHCSDGSDEIPQACCEKSKCELDEWCCLSNGCVPHNFYCDGRGDCSDWSDEDNCRDDMDSQCKADFGLFPCSNGYRCIMSIYVCDGTDDCGDNSDEQKCNTPTPGLIIVIIIIITCLIFISTTAAVTFWLKFKKQRTNNNNTRFNNNNRENFNTDNIWNTPSRQPSPSVLQNPWYSTTPGVQDNPLLRPYFPCTEYTPSADCGSDIDLPPSYESVVNDTQVNCENWQSLQTSGDASGDSCINGASSCNLSSEPPPPPYSLLT